MDVIGQVIKTTKIMGAWGPGILQNDTTEDIWAAFKDHYNKGLSPKEIRVLLEKEYNPE
jgi:hypothetical protein